MLGSWGQRLHLGRVCQFERHHAECWALREKQAGSMAEAVWGRRTCSLVYGFLWNLFWEGPFPEVGRLRSWRLGGALNLLNYLVLFLPWRTKVSARFCLPFHLKAARCKGGRLFFLIKGEISSCHFGEWSCLPSSLILPLLAGKKARQRGIFHHSFLPYKEIGVSNSAHSLLPLDGIYSTSVTFPIFRFQVRSKRVTVFFKVWWWAICSW